MPPEEGAQKSTFLQLWDTRIKHLTISKLSTTSPNQRRPNTWIIGSRVHARSRLTDVSLDWNLLPSAGETAVQVTNSLGWCRHLWKNLSVRCPDRCFHKFKYRGESLSCWSGRWAGLIDQPIETPNSTSAFKDFKTRRSTPLWFLVKLLILYDIVFGERKKKRLLVLNSKIKNKKYHSVPFF